MPLYTGVGGVKSELSGLYTGVDGVKRELNSLVTSHEGVVKTLYKKSAPSCALGTLDVGSEVVVYEGGEAVPYIVICHDYPKNSSTLAMRKYVTETTYSYNTISTAEGSPMYKNSTPDKYLTNGFYQSLDANQKLKMTGGSFYGYDMLNAVYTISRKVILLSSTEISSGSDEGTKIPYFSSNALRVAYDSSGNKREYWLRTLSYSLLDQQATARYVTTSGSVLLRTSPGNYSKPIRPCILFLSTALVTNGVITGE